MRRPLMRNHFASSLLLVSAAIVAAIVTCVFPSHLASQTPTSAPPPFAVIEGVAIDSLHQDFLRGAVLTVEGAEARATTDAKGRFRLDSVPPGVRRVAVMHPLLDTVGVSLVTPPLKLVAGQHLNLVVSTPSAETLLALKCTPGERSVGPVMLLGSVEYAESQSPASGAKVELEWIDHRISAKSIEAVPRARSATVGEDGRFKVCGLPQGVSGTVTAVSGVDSTSSVDFNVAGAIGVISLDLPDPLNASLPGAPAASGGVVSPGIAAARAPKAILSGRVLDPTGAPLPRARVSIDADTAFAVTGQDGRFTIHNLRTGTRQVSVRRLGFEPTVVVVALRSTRATDITVKLGEFVAVLDTVTIRAVAQERGLERVGFARRQRIASGYFITPQELEKRNAFDVNDLLTMVPMLRRTTVNGRTVIGGRSNSVNVGAAGATSFSPGCVTYYVDGIQWSGGDVNDFVSPSEVAAIEVYSKGFTPAQFRRAFNDCETVVIWTKTKIR